ncbi:penicillin-binding transpeptidase domain-containing protein [Stigmatella sp. ncwal1]|uniref:Penicillin-binding transpeptidase domain-containing protein n=1 Tax=Stigmatella ashevillensis TaxID=2995309 RepID=A0ABT5DJ18_9BACT|nr:penicillin-binding transpeptidase domain-containing protein [Stigmatella ashevillena]MDC0712351.1 penicillin-binding transpeptidase domain-containing protein [Stigmatella ashevillena]
MLLAACVSVRSRPAEGPLDEAQAYLHTWAAGDFAALRSRVTEPPASFEAQHQRFQGELRILSSRFELGRIERQEESAEASFRAIHLLQGLGEWEVDGTLRLVRRQGRWWVRWTPAVLHPEARDGSRFSRTRTRPERAALLDGRGQPLTHEGEVITIGVEPRRIQNLTAVSSALQSKLGVDPVRIQKALSAPGVAPERFLPLIDVRPERYQQVRPALAPVPGIFFRRKNARLSPAEGFAAHALGRVGEVTAELLPQLGPAYQPGDTVGLSGLELAYEPQLAGSPSGEVRLTLPSGKVRVLHRFTGSPGVPLHTTLLPEVQSAAEAALEGLAQPAALVAVDPRTGAILAVASRPLEQPLNRAFTGRYPPGSTFKAITAEAVLATGLGPDARVSCPPEVRVGGKRFRNFEGESFGDTSLRLAFAHSCNTAFVMMADALPADALGAAARRFGFGVSYPSGLPSPGASFPPPRNEAEQAAAALGQGRVLVTPLHMASVAAAAAAGRWRAPYLLTELAGGPSASLATGTRAPLHALMRAAVIEGTGKAAAGIAGLVGKTGTAEFGNVLPLPTHAWFIGSREGIGFAVLVEGGGVGGRVAVPIAARFASALSPAPLERSPVTAVTR